MNHNYSIQVHWSPEDKLFLAFVPRIAWMYSGWQDTRGSNQQSGACRKRLDRNRKINGPSDPTAL